MSQEQKCIHWLCLTEKLNRIWFTISNILVRANASVRLVHQKISKHTTVRSTYNAWIHRQHIIGLSIVSWPHINYGRVCVHANLWFVFKQFTKVCRCNRTLLSVSNRVKIFLNKHKKLFANSVDRYSHHFVK